MAASLPLRIVDLRFEHYPDAHQLGTHTVRPRISWTFEDALDGFRQEGYEIELYDRNPTVDSSKQTQPMHSEKVDSNQNILVPWPLSRDLQPRERIWARIRAWGNGQDISPWSKAASIETGLVDRSLWKAQLISSPWDYPTESSQPEELFRKTITLSNSDLDSIRSARLYITAQGVYEAEINGKRVGDHFMAPGWTVYTARLRYQCYDVTELLHSSSSSSSNVLGVRVAEGWFCGRLGWTNFRSHFGDRPALLAQLEVTHTDGQIEIISTDESWTVTRGPIQAAEIYDGEKYDAQCEVPGWSSSEVKGDAKWEKVVARGPLPAEITLVTEEAEPVRRIETVKPVEKITTPSGQIILDFGQNLVGYTRIIKVKGARGSKITLSHAEVLEKGELGVRPLRKAANTDEYTLKGDPEGETYEPRFTFHGYRYVQVGGWPTEPQAGQDMMSCLEAVVCHTDMRKTGKFECSDSTLSRFHDNVEWSMRGNFLSVPTDCPQRDERLGWTGDLAMFGPTATLLYNCTDMLRGWMRDLYVEQTKNNGIPPLVVPNVLAKDPMFGHVIPCAVWSDVTVLVPWTLYQATGDIEILREQYQSMLDWVNAIPRNKTGNTHLWDWTIPQLGDWLDPTAPPDNPGGGKTDSVLVADAFLIQSLDIIAQVAALLDTETDATKFRNEAATARSEFAREYISSAGRLVSDAQTAYALAIVFNLYPTSEQRDHGAERLVYIVRKNGFKIGTGFAGTPYICEALTQVGHPEVAYAMLYNKSCPSWLYSVDMGATTIWERYDSMLPDGSINPGEMTSFNHYALGAVARWLWERAAGLQCAAPGWKKLKFAPIVGGDLTSTRAQHETPFGTAVSSWTLTSDGSKEDKMKLEMEVVVPPNTTAEVVFPKGSDKDPVEVTSGRHIFTVSIDKPSWPVEPIRLW